MTLETQGPVRKRISGHKRGRGVMGGMTTTDEADEHYGYEVEYLTTLGLTGDKSGGVKTCAHPSARDYSTSTSPGSGERVSTLRIFDEQEEEIAAYNGMSWIAVRRLARPSGAGRSTL